MTNIKSILGGITFFAGLSIGTFAGAAEIILPVAKDASVIRSSYCCGFVPDQNFGDRPTVDAGQYHHESQALFGFNTATIRPWMRVAKVELVIPSAQISGSSPATFILSKSADSWDEMSVTWNTKPVASKIADVSLTSGERNVIDITEAFKESYNPSRADFTLALDSNGMANVFVVSKEADPAAAAYLVVTTRRGPGL